MSRCIFSTFDASSASPLRSELGEVFYITLREAGHERANQVAHLILTLPIQVISVDLELAKKAVEFKASKKMSYADCFAAALAKLRNVELVTGDKEFKQVEGEVKVFWFLT